MPVTSRFGFAVTSLVLALAACNPFDRDVVVIDGIDEPQKEKDQTKHLPVDKPVPGPPAPSDSPAASPAASAPKTPTWPETSPGDEPAAKSPPAKLGCTPDLASASPTGAFEGDIRGYKLRPIDAVAFEAEGGFGNGTFSATYRELTIVFTETASECSYYERSLVSPHVGALRVEVRNVSSTGLPPTLGPGTYRTHDEAPEAADSFVEVRLQELTGDRGCPEALPDEQPYRPLGGPPASTASGSITILERTAAHVAGFLTVGDRLGHTVSVAFSAPICGSHPSAESACCSL